MASKFTAGMKNVVEVLNQMWDAFAAGPYNALPLSGGVLTGSLTAPAITATRLPVDSINTAGGAGWLKIAKLKTAITGLDAVIRVSGATSYGAVPGRSNGVVTTILIRVDNDYRLSGSFHTETAGGASSISDVRFGLDGAVYVLVDNYQQVSVYVDAHPQLWEVQAIVYHSASSDIPAGAIAVRAWGLRIGSPEGYNLLVNETDVTTICNIRGRYLIPTSDNVYDIGLPAQAYRTIYARTGTINTSDARLKCDFRDLTAAEIAASRDIARAIGIYRWRDAVDCKGEGAREHIGPTVQTAIEIMQGHGLNPFNYGFICHDSWERQFVEHQAVEARAAVQAIEAAPAVLDSLGNLVTAAVPASPGYPAIEARAAYTEVVLEAGDRYAFRYDELAMFIAAGQEARLAALEAAQ